MKAILIVNPVSGRTMISEYIDDILLVLKKKRIETTTLMTKRKNDEMNFARDVSDRIFYVDEASTARTSI